MCVGDYKIDRLVRSVAYRETLASGGGVDITANRQRVGIVFCADTDFGGDVRIMSIIGGSSVKLTTIGSSNGFITFNMRDHGDLPCRQWRIQNNTASPVGVEWFEMFLPEEVLHKTHAEIGLS